MNLYIANANGSMPDFKTSLQPGDYAKWPLEMKNGNFCLGLFRGAGRSLYIQLIDGTYSDSIPLASIRGGAAIVELLEVIANFHGLKTEVVFQHDPGVGCVECKFIEK